MMRVVLFVMMLMMLAACGQVSPTPTPTATSTRTPSPTRTPTPTPIPETLDTPPQVIAADDLSLLSGLFMFQVNEVTLQETLGEQISRTDEVYLVISGHAFNYEKDKTYGFHNEAFPLTVGEAQYISNPTFSSAARVLYPDAQFPSARGQGFTLVMPPAKSVPIVLAYSLPDAPEYFQLGFDTIRGQVSMGLIVQPDADGRLTLIKVEENQESLVSIDLIPQDETLEAVIDSEEVEVDNCYGTTEITRKFMFEKQESFKATYNTTSRAADVRIGNEYIAALLNQRLTQEFGEITLDQLTSSRTEELAAAVGTRPRWRMEWYLVSVKGIARVTVGDYRYDIPYTRTDRLRSQLVSIPSEPCP